MPCGVVLHIIELTGMSTRENLFPRLTYTMGSYDNWHPDITRLLAGTGKSP